MGISVDTLIIALTWFAWISGYLVGGFVIIVLGLLFLDWFNNWRRRMNEVQKDKIT